MEPVEWKKGAWQWTERGGHVVWAGGDLARNLGAILIRRTMDAQKAGETPLPLASLFPTSLADIAAFTTGQTDDQKLEDLVWGLIGSSTTKALHLPSTLPSDSRRSSCRGRQLMPC